MITIELLKIEKNKIIYIYTHTRDFFMYIKHIGIDIIEHIIHMSCLKYTGIHHKHIHIEAQAEAGLKDKERREWMIP